MSKVLEYPLTPIPSLSDGAFNKMNKAQLLLKVETHAMDDDPSYIDVFVDALFLLNTMSTAQTCDKLTYDLLYMKQNGQMCTFSVRYLQIPIYQGH